MSQAPTRIAKPGSAKLLTRILDQPDLVRSVRELPPQAFGKLIHHIGLEDAGELVALATTDQLRQIFDDDLWRSEKPGRDETFDAERFALWLEVMLEVGEEFAARKLTELSEDLVTLALNRHILVIDVDALAVQMADRSDDESEQLEKALSSAPSHDFDGYSVMAKREEGWDAILGVLVALNQNHHDFLQRVLERCAYASSELLDENGGLYEVLTAAEMLESDAAAEREDRRAGEGYVAPSTAVSFLALARTTKLAEIEDAKVADPVTRAYFRMYGPDQKAPENTTRTTKQKAAHEQNATAAPAEVDKLLQVLKEAEVLDDTRPTLLLSDGGSEDEKLFKKALIELAHRDGKHHERRMLELSYLANVLVAGCSLEGKSFRPLQAAEAVLAVCNLGCEHLVKANAKTSAYDVVSKQSADKLFRIGWHLLYRDVAQIAVRTVEKLIAKGDQVSPIGRLSRELQRAIAQKKPWLVYGKLGALDTLITPDARVALQSLLDECPRLVNAPNGKAAFIATTRQLREAARFLGRL